MQLIFSLYSWPRVRVSNFDAPQLFECSVLSRDFNILTLLLHTSRYRTICNGSLIDSLCLSLRSPHCGSLKFHSRDAVFSRARSTRRRPFAAVVFRAWNAISFIRSSEWGRATARRELLSGYKLGAKWRETVRCSTREDIAAMYRITGTRFYSGHGRIVGNGGDAAAPATIAVVSTTSRRRRRRRRRRTLGWRRWKAVEIRDRRITNACRPSFVAGALTANSKLR